MCVGACSTPLLRQNGAFSQPDAGIFDVPLRTHFAQNCCLLKQPGSALRLGTFLASESTSNLSGEFCSRSGWLCFFDVYNA